MREAEPVSSSGSRGVLNGARLARWRQGQEEAMRRMRQKDSGTSHEHLSAATSVAPQLALGPDTAYLCIYVSQVRVLCTSKSTEPI